MTIDYDVVISIDDGTQETLDHFTVTYIDSCESASIIDQSFNTL